MIFQTIKDGEDWQEQGFHLRFWQDNVTRQLARPHASKKRHKKAGFWYFLICNTFRSSLFEACATPRGKGDFRFAAWRGRTISCGPQSLCVARANLGIELRSKKGVRLCARLLALLPLSFPPPSSLPPSPHIYDSLLAFVHTNLPR